MVSLHRGLACPQKEYRAEIVHTPFTLAPAARPTILSLNGQTDRTVIPSLKNGANATLVWGSTGSGSLPAGASMRVSLVAPGAATHGFNANQRVVLPTVTANAAAKSITFQVPRRDVAIPQYYMIFVLADNVFSQARWIQVVP